MTKIREHYSHIQIALHWLIVLMIGFNYIFSDGMGRFYRAHLKGEDVATWPAMVHVYVGLAVFWLVVIRMVVRWRMGAPAEVPNDKEWMTVASKWTHRLLYALMLFAPWAGLAAWFGEFRAAAEAHEILINALMIVAGVHAAAALYHHFILKDGLLKRMWFKH